MTVEQRVRVRFAPSPTGYLHIGGARTALFNYLYARHSGGDFILRIEDTDLERNSEEAMHDILDGLRWLGMEWDEGPEVGGGSGPYFQSQRKGTYAAQAGRLLESGSAYPCFCTSEALEAERQTIIAEGRDYRYQGTCRNLPPEVSAARVKAGEPHVIRFAIPPGETVVHDVVRGEVRFDNSLLDDFIIVKSDGMAAYNFAVVVDDSLMGISHVIRGEDHLSNTPRQILLYEALGCRIPVFAHIPLITGTDKARLSKRHGATAVTAYREMGILPEALVNFLALLGWGYGDRQIFDRDELISLFTVERVNKNPAVFDMEKLEWMNGQYIRALSLEEFLAASMPFLTRSGVVPEDPGHETDLLARRALALVQDRARRLDEVPELTAFFFASPREYEAEAAAKWFTDLRTAERLTEVIAALESLDAFDAPALEECVRELAVSLGLKAGELIHPIRLALTGRKASPGLFETMEVIGREECLSRLRRAVGCIQRGAGVS